MQIIVDVNRSGEGRLSGDVRPFGGENALPFSGTIELLARIEELCPTETAHAQ
jgi:hypothetical protein